MKVILSSGKAGRFYHLASSLQNAGYLHRFITSIYFKHLGNNDIFGRYLTKFSKGRVYNRYNKALKPDLVKPIFYPEIIRRAIRFFPFVSNGFSTKLYNYLFDSASRKYIENTDIFYVTGTHGLFSAQKAKQMGATVVIDFGNAHPHFLIRILREEAEKFNIEIKLNYEYYLNKMLQEFTVADFIFLRSDFAYKTFLEQGILPAKLKIIISGIDVHRFTPKIKKDKVFRIIFVGELSIRKGLQYLLKAYQELELPNSELLLIGRPVSHIWPILREYDGYFRHIPMVLHRFINEYYSNATIFVLPSLVEGSANVIYEAMACGLPVIVTENCGSIARDGKDGFVVPIRDIDALKEKILLLYKGNELCREMGKSARRNVERYSWENYEKRLIETLNEIIKLPK